MVFLLDIFLLLDTAAAFSYNINVYCPNMYNGLTERVLSAYTCYVIYDMILVSGKHILEDHVELQTSNNPSESKAKKINNILETLIDTFMKKHCRGFEVLLIPIDANIFDDGNFDDEANKKYIANLINRDGQKIPARGCVYNFVHFAKITTQRKISFLDFFYKINKEMALKNHVLLINTDFDAWDDKLKEFAAIMNTNNYGQYLTINVCFNMDLSELTGLFVNKLDTILQTWFLTCHSQNSLSDLAASVEKAKSHILQLYSEKQNCKSLGLHDCQIFEKVEFITDRFFISDYRYAIRNLPYNADSFSSDITRILDVNLYNLCCEFEEGFINHLKFMENNQRM